MPDVVASDRVPWRARLRRPAGTEIVLVVSLLALAVVVALCAAFTYRSGIQLWLGVAAVVAFVPAVLALRRLEARGAVRRMTRLLFGTAFLLNLLAVTGSPATSDDDWRYLWDGIVQLHGIDPYRYAPSAPELTDVRNPTIYPPSHHCPNHSFTEAGSPPDTFDGCTRMNRPDSNTIYPPVAEGFFTLLDLVTFGGHGNEFSMQVAAGIGVMLIGWLLYRRVRARGDPSWWVALWLWFPTVILEATQNAHIDWLGVLLVVTAITAVPARRAVLRGVLIGAAVGVKLYPGLVGASMVKRRPVALIGSAVALFALTYVPHVLAVGPGVVGFLPGYLQQEDYANGDRFLLISLVFHGTAATVVALCIAAVAVAWAVWRGDPDHPERTAVVTFGVAMLVTTPNQPWYGLLLVALAVLAHRPEWLVFGPVMGFFYLVNDHVPDTQLVGRWLWIVALLVVVGTTVGRELSGRPRASRPDPVATSAA